MDGKDLKPSFSDIDTDTIAPNNTIQSDLAAMFVFQNFRLSYLNKIILLHINVNFIRSRFEVLSSLVE